MSTFLSGTAVTLSILALMASGFAVYQVFEIRQNLNPAGNLEKITPPTPNKTSLNQSPKSGSDDNNIATANPSPKASAAPSTTASPKTKPAIQPGQFVQPALTNQAQVELLSVKRIEDPQTGNRDVVNVQMRIRSQANDLKKPTYIEVGQTTARNPNTSETYKAVDASKHSTEKVDISQIAKGGSADAYVWLRLPEKVDTLDIFVPKTAQFNQVPISQ